MKTKLITIKTDGDIETAVAEAAEVLDGGGLVGFPTETVYGIAARLDRAEAMERLTRLKNRPAGKPFTLHIGEKPIIDRYVPGLSLLDRQFLRRAWPGPLTVIFNLDPRQQEQANNNFSGGLAKSLYHNNSIGIRLPDQRTARRLLSKVDGPVVAPSANLAGRAAPTTAEDVLEQLDGQIDLLIDDGPARFAGSSTIVEMRDDTMEIIRQGVLEAAALERMRRLTILLVCTGNSCRSPMAEGLFKARMAEKLACSVDQLYKKGYKITSAGVMAFDGASATEQAVLACRELKVDIGRHKAQRLTVEMLDEADFVFVMDLSHYEAIRRSSPQVKTRTALLAVDREIEDPIGMSVEMYRKCAGRIVKAVDDQFDGGLSAWGT